MKTQKMVWWTVPMLVAAACLVLGSPAKADTTLTDVNSTASFDTDGGLGMWDWTVDGIDHMAQQWFWYRVGPTGPEAPLANGGGLVFVGEIASNGDFDPGNENLALRYLAANGTFQIDVNFNLSGGTVGSNASDISEVITITNLTGSSLDFHFFQYSDFDLGGTVSDLSARIGVDGSGKPYVADQWDASFVMSETTENPSAAHAEVNFFANTVLALGDGGTTTLNDVLGPLGPGDLTWAFQWDFVLGPDGTFHLSKDKQVRPFIPEPMTMAGLVLGIGALAGYVRRRAA